MGAQDIVLDGGRHHGEIFGVLDDDVPRSMRIPVDLDVTHPDVISVDGSSAAGIFPADDPGGELYVWDGIERDGDGRAIFRPDH